MLLIATIFCLLNPVGASSDATKPIANFTLPDYRGGKSHSLNELRGTNGTALLMIGTECPVVKLYGARINQLATELKKHQVTLVLISPNQLDSATKLGAFARQNKIELPILKDAGAKLADQLAATRVPEVVLLDAKNVVVYQGLIDDQFGIGYQKLKADKNYLLDAAKQLAKDGKVSVGKTTPVGCKINKLTSDEAKPASVTFSEHIAPLLEKRCVSCHQSGDIAPFELRTYADARGWAEMIDEVVANRRMPPWHADPAVGKFSNENRLTDAELKLVSDWVKAGAPEGKAGTTIGKAKTVASEWHIGKPDLELSMPKPYHVPATGEIRYQHIMIDPKLESDTWVTSAEIIPGNRAVVHHVLVLVMNPEERGQRRGEFGSQWLAAYAPGSLPMQLPTGHAKYIPKGSKIVLQMHYTSNGIAQSDQTKIGLKFAKEDDVTHVVMTKEAANHRFRIPANADNHAVEASYRFSQPMTLTTMFPHMHLRGKSFSYEAEFPDGKKEKLLSVPQYDFGWQAAYKLAEQREFPKGTVIRCRATFDNSGENLSNPDPSKVVTWGDQTWEEMMIGYFDATIPKSQFHPEGPAAGQGQGRGAIIRRLLGRG